MDYKKKYEALLSILINVVQTDCSQRELDEASDAIDDYKDGDDVNFWDALELAEKNIASNLRTQLKEKINLDLNNLNVDECLELLEINPASKKLIKCVKSEFEDIEKIKLALLEKKKILNKIQGR